MFDAYTVKKVLPRLVIAVVLIQLSWFIFTGMISLTTAVAYGVEGLIYAPFGGGEALELDNILMSTPGGVGLFSLMAVAGGLGILGIALSLAGTALLGLLLAFALLMFRQVLIVALLVVSPLALVAWILPNTEKFWKLWWESFSKLLIVYPLILGVIAIGRVFAFITAGVEPGGETDSLFTDLGADVIIKVCFIVICFFGPFFFIPKLFTIAGSAFGFVAGMANDKSRGAFDRLKKGRQAKRAEQGRKFLSGNLGERTALGARINRIGAGLGAGAGNHFGIGGRGQAAVRQRKQAAAEEAAKSNAQLQQLGQNDDDGVALLGLSGGNRQGFNEASAALQNHWYERRLQTNLQNGMGQADAEREARAHSAERIGRAQDAARAVGVNRENAGAAFNMLAQNKARSLQGPDAMALAQLGARNLGGGDAQTEQSALQGFMFHARGNGRADLGDTNLEAAWERQSIGTIVQGDTRSTQNFADQISADWNSGDADRMQHAARQVAELQGAMPGATEGNAEIIRGLLNDTVGYDPNARMGLEDQMAVEINRAAAGLAPGQAGPAPTIINGEQIAKGARKYSKDTTEAERQAYLAAQQAAQQGGISDARLKQNVLAVGQYKNITLYQFQYLLGDKTYVGVIAQELLDSHPDAVIVNNNGYYAVDYAKLGLQMIELEAWEEHGMKAVVLSRSVKQA